MAHLGASASYALDSSPMSAAMSSSPITGTATSTQRRRKERRNPSVTPRRFGRFFKIGHAQASPTARIALRNIDASANDRQLLSPSVSLCSDAPNSDSFSPTSPTSHRGGESRKRKGQAGPESDVKRRDPFEDDMPPPPLIFTRSNKHDSEASNAIVAEQDFEQLRRKTRSLSSVLDETSSQEERRQSSLGDFFRAKRSNAPTSQTKILSDILSDMNVISQSNNTLEDYKPNPIRKFANRGFESLLLNREQGFSSYTGQQYLTSPACDPRIETACFYSRNVDLNECRFEETPRIPFCMTNYHKTKWTLVGDEEGILRQYVPSEPGQDEVADVRLRQLHDNAIADMSLSVDDCRLATASGNKGHVVDTYTMRTVATLDIGRWVYLKQVAFQQGKANGDVLASSDRAGQIHLWDLRCGTNPSREFCASSRDRSAKLRLPAVDPVDATSTNTLHKTHMRTIGGETSASSVTSIKWFPDGREHLLLSASESDACIKLWDTRYIKSRSASGDTPLAVTREPASHTFRSYGITSLALSEDSSRFYAVCKDNTVYAYSTAHLMLGQAPELLDGADKRRPTGAEGIGPLYGFKHDALSVRSFYVKCAIRPRALPNGEYRSSELLAVGSSDFNPILFPTDERYLRLVASQRSHLLDVPATGSDDATPIFRIGTPLINAHSREVTCLSWDYQGKLITASDDCVVRAWHEDDGPARDYRQMGYFGGGRHMAGWADVSDDWDAEDDE